MVCATEKDGPYLDVRGNRWVAARLLLVLSLSKAVTWCTIDGVFPQLHCMPLFYYRPCSNLYWKVTLPVVSINWKQEVFVWSKKG